MPKRNSRGQIDYSEKPDVIVDCIQQVYNPKFFDLSDCPLTTIKAGHIVIKSLTSNLHKPLPEMGELPANHIYIGVLLFDILSKWPYGRIMSKGSVDVSEAPYPISDEAKAALPNIKFIE